MRYTRIEANSKGKARQSDFAVCAAVSLGRWSVRSHGDYKRSKLAKPGLGTGGRYTMT